MGSKNKLKRFRENETFANVIQPTRDELVNSNFKLKGQWRTKMFKNNNPLVLELGCGKGEYSVALAQKYPNKNFIGIDIKGARFWRGAKTAIEDGITNVAFLRTQIELIDHAFAEHEVDEIWITFPDPQPKDRLERKRLTSPMFINRYATFLQPNGIIHLKTDHEGFFNYTLDEIKRCNFKLLESTHSLYNEMAENLDPKTQEILNIKTFYEKLFSAKGHSIHYCKFQLTNT